MNWLSQDHESIWHPFTPFPAKGPRALLSRAHGAYVFDEAGRSYLDATSSWWCQIHGHCHPKLVSAMENQARQMDQVLFAPHTHRPAVELAMRLLETLGIAGGKVFYSDNGSTAVEVALKLSLQYWQIRGEKNRSRFLALEGAYHGDTLGAVSVSHVSQFHEALSDVSRGNLRVDPADRELKNARAMVEQYGKEIAALIVEPLVQGAAGMRFIHPQWMDQLVSLCREQGILIIYDEVFTGFGRTGTFFAQNQLAEKPDFTCLSKGLTSGMLPLAVTVVDGGIPAVFRDSGTAFFHGHTFTANPITCALAVASLRLFEEEQTLDRVQAIEELFRNQVARFNGLGRVINARAIGGIFALELVIDKARLTVPKPENGPGWSIAEILWEKGYWIRPLHNTLYLVPPYCVPLEDLAKLLDILYREINDERHFTPFF